MVDGLIQNWLLDPDAFDLVATAGARWTPARHRAGAGAGGDARRRAMGDNARLHGTEATARGCSSVDRVLASEAEGRGFDPRQPRQIIEKALAVPGLFCCLLSDQ
jgi:hypothetical protein